MTLDVTLRERLPNRTTVLGVAAVGGYVAILGWAMEHWPYDYWGALLVAPVLLAISWPVIARLGASEGDVWFSKVLLLALCCKFAAALARYYTTFVQYGGNADASVYDRNARRLAPLYWAGDFGADVGWPHFVGSGFLIVVTAILYILIKPTLVGAFLVFAWMSFWGVVLAWRAFRLALPEGDHRKYLVLVLFLPSMLFWPASIGKEAWMTLAIGLCLYGSARILTNRKGGIVVLCVGLAAALAVRPHVAALCAAGLVIGYLIRPPKRRTSLTPLIKTVGILVVVGIAVIVVQRAAGFAGIDELSVAGVQGAIEDQSSRTEIGTSSFTPTPLTSPLGLPMAAITVIFRPFPFEAHNVQALVAAAEGLLLMVLVGRSWRTLLSLRRLVRRQPYIALAAAYVFGFIIAFSSFSNFGLLARERSQLTPLILVLLCVPALAADPRTEPALRTLPDRFHPHRTRISA